jgi:predicted lipoprotein with Yx(FWY)xxD motif
MHHKTIRPITVGLGAATLGIGLLAAACSTGQPAATSAGQGSDGATVSVRTVGGAAVLVDSAGKALYTNNQDRPGRPICTGSDCHAIWEPLTVHGARPTTGAKVTGKVASVALRDGTRQVTWKGLPLYTFSLDHGPGDLAGNGVHDSFGGTRFVWHAAVSSGHAAAQSSGGSGYAY